MPSTFASEPSEAPAEMPGNRPAKILGKPAGDAAGPQKLDYPATLTSQVNWGYVFWFALIHLVACGAVLPWLFSWVGLGLLLVAHYLCATIGISVCYNRMLAQRAFKAPKWLEHMFVTFAVCNLQDSPSRWVGVHRRHHQFTYEQEDPHRH